VILWNVDGESFKSSNVRLRGEFDHIFTAQDVGSYKPNQRNFDGGRSRSRSSVWRVSFRASRDYIPPEALYHELDEIFQFDLA
jgi:FMN phosphatase YigB (HAD superfamily)